jgi:antitoxin YefM
VGVAAASRVHRVHTASNLTLRDGFPDAQVKRSERICGVELVKRGWGVVDLAGWYWGRIRAGASARRRLVRGDSYSYNGRHDGHHDRRPTRPAAVLISPEELESLEDTLELLSDPDAMRQLAESRQAYAAGDFVTGEELRSRSPAK